MAKTEKLAVEITATDHASAVVDKVADKVDDLAGEEHDVKLGADTSGAEAEIRNLDSRLDGLTNDEKRVVLKVQARDAQREIDKINADLAKADRFSDEEIQIRLTARGDASAKLDAIQSEIRSIDGATPKATVSVDDNASHKLDQIDSKLDALDGRTARVSVAGAAAGGAAVGAAVGAGIPVVGDVLANAQAAGDLALQVQLIADLTGSSLEEADQLAQVWRGAGIDLNDLADVLLQVNGVLQSEPELAEQLGITDANSLIDQFLQAVTGVQTEFDNAGERGAAASRLFGEEGVRQVQRVQTVFGDFQKEVESREPLIDEADVERSRRLNEQAQDLKSKWDQVQLTVLRTLNLITSKEFDDTIVRTLDRWGGGTDDLSGQDILRALGNDTSPVINNLPSFLNGPASTAPSNLAGQALDRVTNIIINPAGTAAQTVEAGRIYERRNDIRYS